MTWSTYSASSQPLLWAHSYFYLWATESADEWWRQADSAWRCVFLASGLVVNRKGSPQWVLSCGHIERVVMVTHALNIDTVGGKTFVQPASRGSNDTSPTWGVAFVGDTDQWEAAVLEWQSPADRIAAAEHAAHEASSSSAPPPALKSGLHFGISGQVNETTSIELAMAKRGFVGISRADVVALLQHHGSACDASASEYDVIKQAILRWHPGGIDELLLLEFLAYRKHANSRLSPDSFFRRRPGGSMFRCWRHG